MKYSTFTDSELFIYINLPLGSTWRSAYETVGGVCLKKIGTDGESKTLSRVKLSQQVFDVLKQKKMKGETIREAAERIILAAPFPPGPSAQQGKCGKK